MLDCSGLEGGARETRACLNSWRVLSQNLGWFGGLSHWQRDSVTWNCFVGQCKHWLFSFASLRDDLMTVMEGELKRLIAPGSFTPAGSFLPPHALLPTPVSLWEVSSTLITEPSHFTRI